MTDYQFVAIGIFSIVTLVGIGLYAVYTLVREWRERRRMAKFHDGFQRIVRQGEKLWDFDDDLRRF